MQRPLNGRWSDKLSFSGAAAPFPRGLRPQARFGAQPTKSALSAEMKVPEGRKGNAGDNVMVLERSRLDPMFDLIGSLKSIHNV